ncbi:DNA repair protein RecN [Pusillimonas sp. ANT_WB101]|uniref:DNA repair protein RecN n=1 Tax=Pusillimonas sp. ANT_WB101 TaxID=2597356 RepID=UPI0011ED3A8E|nr:DNA repair protein RecN [Pusillimonas sp. ANT_WB101]KAA0889979.1 DNA repair protein RecN [Pusillimonas sp. ANT_WB101]
MLRTLHIRDFVIVDEAELHFDAGFTVFSGETGAGKSILVDALSLALGARGDVGVLREGSARADITAIFDPPASVQSWLQERELLSDDGLLLRRVIDAQGRSRAFINGIPVALGQLREVGEYLVDIHGQHAHQSLLKASSQRALLDAQGGHSDLAREVQQAWQTWHDARKKLDDARQNAAALQEERERIEWRLAELDRLALQPDEWEALGIEHSRLAHAQALLDGAAHALSALDDEQGAARQALTAAAHHIQPLLRHDTHLQSVYDAIDSARIGIDEAVSDLNSYLDRVELDPDRLAQAEQRLAAIFEMARKFSVEPGELPSLRDDLQQQLDASQSAADTKTLEANEQAAAAQYNELAARLSKARQKIGKTLAKRVSEAMQTLSMQGGRFDVTLSPCTAGPHGTENVEFLVAGHAGTSLRPLAKVASGGELARISLALSVIASQAARVPTLIFDEVDTGIGGAVAEVVGRLLRTLGERHQVLCVTHLPQVAARGMHHYEVRKNTGNNGTVSTIEMLDDAGRVTEVARMLGGLKITDTTRTHAREMLESQAN